MAELVNRQRGIPEKDFMELLKDPFGQAGKFRLARKRQQKLEEMEKEEANSAYANIWWLLCMMVVGFIESLPAFLTFLHLGPFHRWTARVPWPGKREISIQLSLVPYGAFYAVYRINQILDRLHCGATNPYSKFMLQNRAFHTGYGYVNEEHVWIVTQFIDMDFDWFTFQLF